MTNPYQPPRGPCQVPASLRLTTPSLLVSIVVLNSVAVGLGGLLFLACTMSLTVIVLTVNGFVEPMVTGTRLVVCCAVFGAFGLVTPFMLLPALAVLFLLSCFTLITRREPAPQAAELYGDDPIVDLQGRDCE